MNDKINKFFVVSVLLMSSHTILKSMGAERSENILTKKDQSQKHSSLRLLKHLEIADKHVKQEPTSKSESLQSQSQKFVNNCNELKKLSDEPKRNKKNALCECITMLIPPIILCAGPFLTIYLATTFL